MSGQGFWTAQQVSDWCGGHPTVATLAAWRTRGRGPKFVKLGTKTPGCKLDRRAVAYPIEAVKQWAVENGLQTQTIAA